MSVARIVNVGPSCKTRERLYQVAELTGSKYALVIGEIPLERRGVLPIDPGKGGTIRYYDDLSKVQRAWADCEDSFGASGDQDSAENMSVASAVWAVADRDQFGSALAMFTLLATIDRSKE